MNANDTVKRLADIYKEDDRRQLADDTAFILGTPQGRRVLIAIMGLGGVYSKLGESASSYDSGKRDAAVELFMYANHTASDMVLLAQQERSQLSAKRKLSIDTAIKGAQK